MAKKNKNKSPSTQKNPNKPSNDSKRQPRGWEQEKSADIPYDDSIESPRSRQTPSMFGTQI